MEQTDKWTTDTADAGVTVNCRRMEKRRGKWTLSSGQREATVGF